MTLAFICAPEVLKRIADRVAKVVETRSGMPILSNVLIATDDAGRLAMTATDLDITAVATDEASEVEIERPGATTIPASYLRDFLKKLGKVDRLHFSADETTATIRAGRSTFKLFALPAADFPDTQPPKAGTRLALTSTQLRRIDKACTFAICADEARYNMCGVFLHQAASAPGILTAVSTDGHRLSRLRLTVEGDVDAMPPVTLPAKAARLLDTIAEAGGDRPIIVEIADDRIGIEAGELRIVSKVVPGTFPDYERVIPAAQAHSVSVERAKLAEALQRVATVVSERGSGAAFEFGGSTLGLSMGSKDANDGRDEIEIEDGPTLRIGFNARYAQAAIESFETHGLELALADAGTAALLTSPGDDSRLVVLMPMRV